MKRDFNLRRTWFEASARARLAGLLDAGSGKELLPPAAAEPSPHLAALGLPGAFDDGVVVGSGRLAGRPVLFAAQEGQFMGGGVGEIHGAKIVGLLRRALREGPDAVLLLLDSGGVRLHEANAGLIAISEIMRAVLAVRAAGIPVIGLIGGSCGAFGGMGIVAKLCSHLVISEEGRLALSGPEVIETVAGVEEFDARDRALVWRVTGGKHRFLMGDCQAFVDDDPAAFRAAVEALLAESPVDVDELAQLRRQQAALTQRLAVFGQCRDGLEVWQALGVAAPENVPMLDARALVSLKEGLSA